MLERNWTSENHWSSWHWNISITSHGTVFHWQSYLCHKISIAVRTLQCNICKHCHYVSHGSQPCQVWFLIHILDYWSCSLSSSKTLAKVHGYFASFRTYNQSLYHSKKQRLPAPARQPDPKLHTKDTGAQAYDQTYESFSELMSQTVSPPASHRHITLGNKQTWRQIWWIFYLSQESFQPSFLWRHRINLCIMAKI